MPQETKLKILCVEDEQDIRENIAEILRDEGFEVFEAENGKVGFDSFIQNKPDLVISDIMMPEINGYGLLKLIRESKNIRNNNVPFIFLSALAQKDDMIKGVNSSANDYLIKPIDFDLMIAKVREKAENLLRVRESHERNIENIKNQVAVILPAELFTYLDVIGKVSSILREEPYGAFPHRRYLEDLDKIYISAMKLRFAIANALDKSTIDHKINSEEEIFTLNSFLNEFVGGLSEKFKTRIQFESNAEVNSLPHLKVDRLVLLDAMRKIFAGMFKSDPEAFVNVAVMIDHHDQMAIIFYLKSQLQSVDLRANLDLEQISKTLDKQNCRFDVLDNKENTAIMIVPQYRLINQQAINS